MRAIVRDVVVVGGGLAGLSAAVALAGDGAKVTLLERRPLSGGRVYSYDHAALGESIDSQHVVVGACTNVLQLCQQAGVTEAIRWYDELLFLEPGGRRSLLYPGKLPAPAQRLLSLWRAPMLGLKDKAGIAAGMAQFLRGYPEDDTESFADWPKRNGQTERAIRRFWEPIVVGTLNDGFERCSVKYVGKVFHECFMRSAEGGRLGVPAAPLSDFFAPVARLAERRGAALVKASVERVEQIADGRWRVSSDSGDYIAEAVILAGDFRQTQKLLSASGLQGGGLSAEKFEPFVAAPITTIHLWYDQDVTQLDYAGLLDTRINWMFNKSRIRRAPAKQGHYVELSISGSWRELQMSRSEILSSALREFELFFPAAKRAKRIKSGVLKEARATFSVTPGLDRFRPTQKTEHAGLYLAGDWTATEWPSTMEGAVRSGRLAAGALVGDATRFMAPEAPATGLMRWFARKK